MGNLLISIKRFFQNKNTVTIFAILIAVGIIYFAYNFRIKRSTEPVNVPYATQEIGPRTHITNDMVSVKKVPGGIVTKNVLTNADNIVDKYVINTGVIPAGGLFFESMVVNGEDLDASKSDDIPDGQTLYAMSVDYDKTFGNSIFPGNYIDIYYYTELDNGKVWIGKFVESIRVLDVQDEKGNSVFETNEDPLLPAKLLFNLPDDMFALFMTVDNIGGIELFPVQRNAKYSEEPGVTRITGAEFQKYVERQAVEQSVINGGKK